MSGEPLLLERERIEEGVGSRVWVACAATAQSGPTCPYCSQSMRSPDPQPGLPAGLAVCRLCQQVLVPASASEWMTQYAVTAAAGGIGGPPAADGTFLPSECSSCGAPYEPDENGRCRYCHTQIAAIQAPVVLEANPYATMPTSGVTTLMDLANTFLRPRRF